MELHDILDLAKRLRGRDKASDPSPRYPRILGELPAERFEQFGKQFIDDTRALPRLCTAVYRQNAKQLFPRGAHQTHPSECESNRCATTPHGVLL